MCIFCGSYNSVCAHASAQAGKQFAADGEGLIPRAQTAQSSEISQVHSELKRLGEQTMQAQQALRTQVEGIERQVPRLASILPSSLVVSVLQTRLLDCPSAVSVFTYTLGGAGRQCRIGRGEAVDETRGALVTTCAKAYRLNDGMNEELSFDRGPAVEPAVEPTVEQRARGGVVVAGGCSFICLPTGICPGITFMCSTPQ